MDKRLRNATVLIDRLKDATAIAQQLRTDGVQQAQSIHRGALAANYLVQQKALFFACSLAHLKARHRRNRRARGNGNAKVKAEASSPRAPAGQLQSLRQRYDNLIKRELRNVHAGIYDQSLTLYRPWRPAFGEGRSALAKGRMLRDEIRAADARRQRGSYRELPKTQLEDDALPPYFLRNFHWQTDGYLSEHSAALYDLSVEFLFLGAGNAMRRQVLPPLHAALREHGALSRTASPKPLQLLDVGCGTGESLRAMRHTFAGNLRLAGLDLSRAYLRHARRRLPEECALHFGNAEELPFPDASFDVVTSVFLFHELPKNARDRAIREMFRVLKPGGRAIFQDSTQYCDGEDVRFFLERFPVDFHEPFYLDYLADPLEQRCMQAGFLRGQTQQAYVSKVCTFDKPAR